MLNKIQFFLITLGLTVGALLLIEEGFQAFLFSNVAMFQKLREPSLYVHEIETEDYWKLHYWFHVNQKDSPKEGHPLLGWAGEFSEETFKHHASGKLGGRVPVLLYGDSFAACAGLPQQECFQGILNTEEAFAKDFFLLNYGVSGYGLDQMYLLFKHSIDNYMKDQTEGLPNEDPREKPFIIFSLLTNELKRSLLTVRERPKPFFTLHRKQLVLQGVPIFHDPRKFYIENPPDIGSFILRLARNQVFPKPSEWMEDKKRESIFHNQLILLAILKELEIRDLPHVFLILYPAYDLNRNDDFGVSFITWFLKYHHEPFISSKVLISQDAIEPDQRIEKYYHAKGHPSAEQVRLLSKEIQNIVLSEQDPAM